MAFVQMLIRANVTKPIYLNVTYSGQNISPNRKWIGRQVVEVDKSGGHFDHRVDVSLRRVGILKEDSGRKFGFQHRFFV